GANFDRLHVQEAAQKMMEAKLHPSIIIDCSHGNSEKKPERQALVLQDILAQREETTSPIVGFMLESNLFEGCQNPSPGGEGLRYGVSITDPCIGWDTTAELLKEAYERTRP
ncbi:MAG TPA: 3-deoxy-7-phosphoheptulonate synthase, partial [Treponema sp.]|nr:3-deoxy-7-phosphoheptulonate synthase [Treponema sp.]